MLVDVDRESQAEFRTGNGTVGTDVVCLNEKGREVKKYVMLRADGANTNTITIGHSATSAADGFILSAGQQSPPIHVNDLNKIFLVGGAAGQAYSWIAC